MNAGQHTIKYKREGDYGKLIPRVYAVEYQNGAEENVFPGTCIKCAYGHGKHSTTCVTRKEVQLDLFGFEN
jgi:hypothetical protein